MVFINGVNLPKIKDETYVINLDGCKSIGTYFIANDVICCSEFVIFMLRDKMLLDYTRLCC